jgi:transposase
LRRDEKLPIAPVPSQKEMEARKVCASYAREQKNRTRHINTQHALFVRQGHTRVVRKDLSTAARREKAAEVLRGHEREEARWILKYLELHEQRLAELKKRIYEEANKDEDMRRLQTVPGVGPLVAYAYAAHVGDGSRFSSGSQVSNYLGLIPCLDYSGTIQRQGHISKRGNGYIRALLLRAAWMSVRSKKGGALRLRYEYMTQRRGLSKKKSAIAITRRLAELLYALMRNKSGYEPRLGDISHWPLVS